MKPLDHAKSSVRRWGGIVEDYIDIHEWIDSSKAHVPDMRHRAMFHHSFGIYLVQEKFGVILNLSSNRTISVRDVAEQHVIEDMGRIPTVEDYLRGMPIYEWLGGQPKRKVVIPLMD